jgi:hypothetical protein
MNDTQPPQSVQQNMFENVVFSIGPVSALIAARFGMRFWLRYEAIFSFVIGLVCFFQPSWILGLIVIRHFAPM